MHPFGYFLVFCLPATYSAGPVEFNTTKSIYTVGDNVKLTCSINTRWMAVSFYRNHSILIGDCLTFYNGCRATNYTLTQHKRCTLSLDNSNPVLYINNVTTEDSNVTFTCLWTSYRDSVSFIVKDPVSTTPYFSANEETVANSIWITVGNVLGAQVFLLFVLIMVWYVRKPNRLWKCCTLTATTIDSVYELLCTSAKQENSPTNDDTNTQNDDVVTVRIENVTFIRKDCVTKIPNGDIAEMGDDDDTEPPNDSVTLRANVDGETEPMNDSVTLRANVDGETEPMNDSVTLRANVDDETEPLNYGFKLQ